HEWQAALYAFIDETQRNVNGTITADPFKGSIELKSRESTHSLFFPEIRGLQSRSFNQQLCGPAAQIGGLPWEILAMRDAKLSQARRDRGQRRTLGRTAPIGAGPPGRRLPH